MKDHLVYNTIPPKCWEDSIPVGNGRMGVTAMCGVGQEILYLNEETIWSKQERGEVDPHFSEKLAQIRQLFLEEKTMEADMLAKTLLADSFTRIRSYESAGLLKIDLHPNDYCKNYATTLNLTEGIARVDYAKDGSHYSREFFASYPDDVIVYRVTSSKTPLNARIGYERAYTLSVSSQGDTMTAIAKTVYGNYRFAVKVKVVTDGNICCEDGDLVVSDTQSFCLYITLATQFRHGADFESSAVLPCADYDTLKNRHVADFSALMNRADICLPEDPELQDMSVYERKRMNHYNKPQAGDMIVQQWQFGRYLLISSSRQGTLPANLQGLWTKALANEWSCDYHTNINLQCNYWGAEVANLSDCHMPLFDYMNTYLLESGKRTARIGYGTRGCVVHHLSDIYDFTAPADGIWGLWAHGGSWLSYHMWEHYLFTEDKAFLKNTAYEFIRQCAIFFLENLKEDKQGHLVYGPSTSPENRYYVPDGKGGKYIGYLTLMSTMDLGIISGLFRNYLEASAILGIDDGDVQGVKTALTKLPPFRIGKDGRLLEWMEEYEEIDKGHYHISHSFALYPGCTINHSTPELLEALDKTVSERLNGGLNQYGTGAINVGWSVGWMMSLLSRLNRSEDAYRMAHNFVSNLTNTNLWDLTAKCFQIDGNLAFISGIAEMLLQSHEGVVALLPALPKVWHSGSFRGLRARGGYELDITWKDMQVTEVCIRASTSDKVTIALPVSQKAMRFVDDAGTVYVAEDNQLRLTVGTSLHLMAE